MRDLHSSQWTFSSQPLKETEPEDGGAQQGPASDAAKCDSSLERYNEAQQRWRNVRYPSTIVSSKNRLRKLQEATLGMLRWVSTSLARTPGYLRSVAAMSSADWKEWRAKTWSHTKAEAAHYWAGTRLLGAEVRIALRLCFKLLRGCDLSRRERRQLTRTAADVFRMVPLTFFVLVPFLEFLLPVVIRLFPNMLPSTFESKLKREEDVKKALAVKLEVARFLSATVAEMAKDIKATRSGEVAASASQLYDFMGRVRAGQIVDQRELEKFAVLFNDELTLDNLERVHLQSMAQFVGIAPYGTDAFLRARLRAHLLRIKADDRQIQREGLESLTESELRQACRDRGMRAPYGSGSRDYMADQMQEWLELSLDRSLPSSLLLLSRAFTLTALRKGETVDSLRSALSGLPDEVVEDVEMEQFTDTRTSPSRKLEYIRREEELIKEELEDIEELRELEQESSTQQGRLRAAVSHAAAAAMVKEAAAGAVIDSIKSMDSEVKDASEEERALRLAAARKKQMRKAVAALAALASASGVTKEREAFVELVESQIQAVNEDTTGGGAALQFSGEGLTVVRPDREDTTAAQDTFTDALNSRVAGILNRIETDLDRAEEKIGEKLHLIDLDNDGVIGREEFQLAMDSLKDELKTEDFAALMQRVQESSVGGLNVKQLMEEYCGGELDPEEGFVVDDRPARKA